tara:strand:- start:3457 stop:4485 length:1029 start_codon:yes stop_codon:yes gene_type:complete
MKLFKLFIILIVFFKTENLLSENNLFNVNNILINKKDNLSNNQLANQAIKEAFNLLSKRILLKKDIQKITDLNYLNIRELVTYYNISKKTNNDDVIFNVTFDKDKIHNLFYNRGILYSDIVDKDFYILPIFLKQNEIYIFSNNYFYKNWNEYSDDDLLEFILPLENIEIIQSINKSRDNLLSLNLDLIFNEFMNKNIAIALIEDNKFNNEKIYIKAKIQGKFISKNLNIKKDIKENNSKDRVISLIKDEITNLVKSENLIDIRTPSFINVKLDLNKKNNLVFLNSKIKKIDLIEDIFVLEFNKDHVKIKIKYLGKLERMINQLKKENITLQLVNDEWLIKNL